MFTAFGEKFFVTVVAILFQEMGINCVPRAAFRVHDCCDYTWNWASAAMRGVGSKSKLERPFPREARKKKFLLSGQEALYSASLWHLLDA